MQSSVFNFTGMIDALDALTELVRYGCFLVGIVIGYLSLKQVILVSQQGLRQPGGYWAAIIGFAVASLLVALPLTTDTFSESLFAQGLQSGESMLSYVNEAAGGCLSGDRRLAMLVLLLYAQLFGIIAIARGLYMFWIVSKRTGSQHITVGSSITFVVGGTLAANITMTLSAMSTFFNINQLIGKMC